jgi:hypothetical protein
MAKTFDQRFAEQVADRRETADAIKEFTNQSYELYGSYSYTAGALGVVLEDAIAELPRARRGQMRERLYRMATEISRQRVVNQLKAAA